MRAWTAWNVSRLTSGWCAGSADQVHWGRVPAAAAGVAGGHVVDVQQDLVAALAAPHLVAAVARIPQNRLDGGLAPGTPVAVGVTGPVGAGGGGEGVGGQAFGDGVVAAAVQVFLEDPFHDGRGKRVGLQPVQPAAKGGLAGMGMGAGVHQPIAVGWSAAEEAPLGGGLGTHGGPDPGLDSVAFALGHAAEQGHDQVVATITRSSGTYQPVSSG